MADQYRPGDFVVFAYIPASPPRFGYIQAQHQNHWYHILRVKTYALLRDANPNIGEYAHDCQVASCTIRRAVWTVLGPVVIV